MIRSRAEYGCRQFRFRLEFHTRSGEPGNALDLTYRLLIHFQPSNPELRQVITLRPHWKRTMGGGFQKIESCRLYWASPRTFGALDVLPSSDSHRCGVRQFGLAPWFRR